MMDREAHVLVEGPRRCVAREDLEVGGPGAVVQRALEQCSSDGPGKPLAASGRIDPDRPQSGPPGRESSAADSDDRTLRRPVVGDGGEELGR